MNALIFIKRRQLGDMEIHYAVHIIFSLTFFLKNRFKRVRVRMFEKICVHNRAYHFLHVHDFFCFDSP